MNVIPIDPQLKTLIAGKDILKPVIPSAWLPLAALLITVAAYNGHAPAKLAAFMRGQPAPAIASSVDLTPTSVNYPVPVRWTWIESAGSDSLIAHR